MSKKIILISVLIKIIMIISFDIMEQLIFEHKLVLKASTKK